MVKTTNTRMVLTLFLYKKYNMIQIDVNNTFLNRDLLEDFYMCQPHGFEADDHAMV